MEEVEKTGDPVKDKKATYDKEIAFVDSRLKELYERFGWSRNTLLVVTSDHGEELMEREVYGHGKSLYNTVIHVPLLFSWPERERIAARRRGVNVSTMDIMPTLISLLGFHRVKGQVGKDLAPELEGKAGAGRARSIYSHLHTWAGTPDQNLWMACLDGDFKYMFKAPDTHFLFDLKRDPGEDRNIYADEPRTAHRLATSLFAFEKSCPRYSAEDVDFKLDEKSIEHLRSLGYVH